MPANKIIMNTENGEEVLIDLTGDSVTPETLAEGITAHDASGNVIIGTAFGAELVVEETNEGVKITATDKNGTTSAIVNDGADGYTPVKYVDYFTYGDIEDIVTRVHESIGTPLFGQVDENNNVVLSGNLADGSYSIKYEMENGSTVNIGNLVLDSRTYYTVTATLPNCKTTNSTTKIAEGEPYKATITANDGYELKSVTVTMGGANVSVTNGVIDIASVTGNIVITAVAEAIVVKDPTNFAGTISVGRLGSDGTIRNDAPDCRVTDFASVLNGDIVRVTGMLFVKTSDVNGTYPSAVYNGSKTKLSSVALATGNTSYYTVQETTTSGAQITIIHNDVKYVRFSGFPTGADNKIVVNIMRNGEWL